MTTEENTTKPEVKPPRLVVIDRTMLVSAIACNTDASPSDAANIVNTVLYKQDTLREPPADVAGLVEPLYEAAGILETKDDRTLQSIGRVCRKAADALTALAQERDRLTERVGDYESERTSMVERMSKQAVRIAELEAQCSVVEQMRDGALGIATINKRLAEKEHRRVAELEAQLSESTSILEDATNMLHKDAKANMPTLPSCVAWMRNELDVVRSQLTEANRTVVGWSQLVEQLAEAQRDAERYRHMRCNATFQDQNGPGLYWYLPRWNRDLPIGERLDASIDACDAGGKDVNTVTVICNEPHDITPGVCALCERDRLRAFCRELFDALGDPNGDVFHGEGFAFDTFAIKHGMLLPNGEKDGVPQYRKADWLAEKAQP